MMMMIVEEVPALMKGVIGASMWLFAVISLASPPFSASAKISDYMVPPDPPFTTSLPVLPAYFLTPPPIQATEGYEATTIAEFPWNAFLSLYKKDGKWYGCNGSIISKLWVMTAAHCFTDENFEAKVVVDVTAVIVFTGLTYKDKRFKFDNPFIQQNLILERDFDEHLKIHKDYKKYVKNNNDIALVKLKQQLNFNKWVQPIKLATTSDVVVGKSLTVSGWGKTSKSRYASNQLMKIEDLKLVSDNQCKTFWERDGKSRITENMLCHWTWGKYTCRGFSGAPVVTGMGLKSGPPFVQIGIVSWGHKNCERYTPDVFVHVAEYRPWIYNITSV